MVIAEACRDAVVTAESVIERQLRRRAIRMRSIIHHIALQSTAYTMQPVANCQL
jgi:hypothetical protein